jgi:hypothetical protein
VSFTGSATTGPGVGESAAGSASGCPAPSRWVLERIRDRFVRQLAEAADTLTLGDGQILEPRSGGWFTRPRSSKSMWMRVGGTGLRS